MAWSLVQHPVDTFASGTSASNSFASSPGSGSLLLALLYVNNASVTFGSAPTGASITGSWVPLCGSGVNATNLCAQSYQAWGAINNATGTSSVGISWTGAGTGDFILVEFTGITGSVVQDGTVQSDQSTTNATTITTPSYTPGVTGDLIVNMIGTSGNVQSINTGWTQGDVNTSGTGDAWGYTTGALSAVTTNATNSNAEYVSIIFGIQASGGGGGGPDLNVYRIN